MKFTVLLFHDPGTDAYEAVVAALPNCVSYGSTMEEALAMAKEAAAIRLALMAEAGDEIAGATEAAAVAAIDIEAPVGVLTLAG